MFICHSVTPAAAAAQCIQDGLNEILRAPFQPLLYGKCGITNYVNIYYYISYFTQNLLLTMIAILDLSSGTKSN